jgi:hypothetical protein
VRSKTYSVLCARRNLYAAAAQYKVEQTFRTMSVVINVGKKAVEEYTPYVYRSHPWYDTFLKQIAFVCLFVVGASSDDKSRGIKLSLPPTICWYPSLISTINGLRYCTLPSGRRQSPQTHSFCENVANIDSCCSIHICNKCVHNRSAFKLSGTLRPFHPHQDNFFGY